MICILLQAKVPNTSDWFAAYSYISVPITMNEKLEMTVNKFAMRVVGNALGSSIGFAIMLSEPVAANPYAIMVRCLRPMRQQAV